jgi:preprotein translocase subunit SecF
MVRLLLGGRMMTEVDLAGIIGFLAGIVTGLLIAAAIIIVF